MRLHIGRFGSHFLHFAASVRSVLWRACRLAPTSPVSLHLYRILSFFQCPCEKYSKRESTQCMFLEALHNGEAVGFDAAAALRVHMPTSACDQIQLVRGLVEAARCSLAIYNRYRYISLSLLARSPFLYPCGYSEKHAASPYSPTMGCATPRGHRRAVFMQSRSPCAPVLVVRAKQCAAVLARATQHRWLCCTLSRWSHSLLQSTQF